MSIVLMCRPGLFSTLLDGGVVERPLNAAHNDSANKDASASDEGSLGEGAAESSEFVGVQE